MEADNKKLKTERKGLIRDLCDLLNVGQNLAREGRFYHGMYEYHWTVLKGGFYAEVSKLSKIHVKNRKKITLRNPICKQRRRLVIKRRIKTIN